MNERGNASFSAHGEEGRSASVGLPEAQDLINIW
jgi:hypothetical protein